MDIPFRLDLELENGYIRMYRQYSKMYSFRFYPTSEMEEKMKKAYMNSLIFDNGTFLVESNLHNQFLVSNGGNGLSWQTIDGAQAQIGPNLQLVPTAPEPIVSPSILTRIFNRIRGRIL